MPKIEQTVTFTRLHEFHGQKQRWSFEPDSRITMSNGVQYVVNTAFCYWIVEEIEAAQQSVPGLTTLNQQLWSVEVDDADRVTLIGRDGNGRKRFEMDFSDKRFPPEGIKMMLIAGTKLILPTEY